MKDKRSFSLKDLYAYVASIIALMFFLFGTVITVSNLSRYFIGDVYFQSYSDFRRSQLWQTEKAGPEMSETESLPADTPELRALYEEEKALSERRNQLNALQNLAGSVTAMLLGLFFWPFFWKQTKN